MALARFHVESLTTGLIRLPSAEARHAKASRRLSVDAQVALFDGAGHETVGSIVTASKGELEIRVDEVTSRRRPEPRLTLAVAPPKGPRQDMLIEKCTELGVGRIQPLSTERSVAGVSGHRIGKWRRTTIEAAKQSGQCWLPELCLPLSIGEITGNLSGFDRVLMADRSGASLVGMLDELSDAKRVIVFVGPEGGWTDEERDLLEAAGARSVSLGPNTLRIETAAVAAAAAVHALSR